MKSRFFYFVICLTVLNCQEKRADIEYKYSNKESFIKCNDVNAELFQEALYDFEHNLSENYVDKNPKLMIAYRQFIKEFMTKNANFNNLSNEHTLRIFEALKQTDNLIIESNNTLALNYKHPVFSCIAENIQDKDLKTTFNALLSTNSLSARMLQDALLSSSSKIGSDKHLATYVALEMYYTQLTNVDLTKKEDPKTNKAKDPHAGHNH